MKFALIGYGKMGRMIEEIALSRGHEIVSIIDIDNLGDFDSDAFRSADVAIEFTAPHVAYDNYLRAFAQGVKVVSGSTGWLKDHGDDVRRMCEKEGKTLFWSSNFSLGVTVFRAVNRYLARIMNQFPDYSPSLSETHHIHKLDYPSGTAITLAEELIAEDDALDGWYVGEAQLADGTVITGDPTGPEKLRIEVFRRDEVPGIHSIAWESDADTITITHDAHTRRGFALGAVLAAEYTATHEGLLTMSDLFKF